MDPPLPQIPSADDVVKMFQAALQDDGFPPLPVADIFYRTSVQSNPLLRSYLEPWSRSHAEHLGINVHKALVIAAEPDSKPIQAGETAAFSSSIYLFGEIPGSCIAQLTLHMHVQ